MVVAMKSSQTPEKKPMRSVTEYIRSPAQLNQIKSEAGKQSRQQTAAKNFFRKNEAQMVADLFRARVEQELEEEVEDWRVTDFQGDLTRKAILKVQVGQDEFVHLYATRPSRNDQWICLYAPFKTPRCTWERPGWQDLENPPGCRSFSGKPRGFSHLFVSLPHGNQPT